jgi:hypothetical protein
MLVTYYIPSTQLSSEKMKLVVDEKTPPLRFRNGGVIDGQLSKHRAEGLVADTMVVRSMLALAGSQALQTGHLVKSNP